MSDMGCLCELLISGVSQDSFQSLEPIATALGYPVEHTVKILLLKTLHL